MKVSFEISHKSGVVGGIGNMIELFLKTGKAEKPKVEITCTVDVVIDERVVTQESTTIRFDVDSYTPEESRFLTLSKTLNKLNMPKEDRVSLLTQFVHNTCF